ncbi:MAG: hypothetical protein SNF68_05730 [Rikenellaceae bacterium]
MTEITIGKVAISHKGEYATTKSYAAKDWVSHNGSSYVSLVDNNSAEPSSTSEKWALLASKGDVGSNVADDEDLQSVDLGDNVSILKFKDKEYAPSSYSGKGRKYLRKNISGSSSENILSQSMINNENTIYVIQYDYDLNGAEITIPDGSILEFQGGGICGGSIIFSDTEIRGSGTITSDVSGTISNKELSVDMFYTNDISPILQMFIDSMTTPLFKANKEYLIESRVYVSGVELDFNNSILKVTEEISGGLSKTGVLCCSGQNVAIRNLTIEGNYLAAGGISADYQTESTHSLTLENINIYNIRSLSNQSSTSCYGIKVSGAIENVFINNITIDSIDNLTTEYGSTQGILVGRDIVNSVSPKNITITNITSKNVTEHSDQYVNPSDYGFTVTPDSDHIKVLGDLTTNLKLDNCYFYQEDCYCKRCVKLQDGKNEISNLYITAKNANIGLIVDDQTGISTNIRNIRVDLDEAMIGGFQAVTALDIYSENNVSYAMDTIIMIGTVYDTAIDYFLRANTSANESVTTNMNISISNVEINVPYVFDAFLDYGRHTESGATPTPEFFSFRNIQLEDLNYLYSSAGNNKIITAIAEVENLRLRSGNVAESIITYATNANIYSLIDVQSIKNSDLQIYSTLPSYVAYDYFFMAQAYPTFRDGSYVLGRRKQRTDAINGFPMSLQVYKDLARYDFIDFEVEVSNYSTSLQMQISRWRALKVADNSTWQVYEMDSATSNNRTYFVTPVVSDEDNVITIDFETKPTSSTNLGFKLETNFFFKRL